MRVKLSGIVLHLLRWLHDPERARVGSSLIKNVTLLVPAAALKPLRSGSGNQLDLDSRTPRTARRRKIIHHVFCHLIMCSLRMR